MKSAFDGLSLALEEINLFGLGDLFYKVLSPWLKKDSNLQDFNVGQSILNGVNKISSSINNNIVSPVNDVLCDIDGEFQNVKSEIQRLEQYITIINDLLKGQIWNLLYTWIMEWFPYASLQTIYFIVIIIAVVLLMVILGGLVSFFKIFI
jgi:hypothetical protein